ncbi:MAG: aldo/keto reductase [Chitinophagaceae bacterium]|nr:aldo/keto reductase [Chitinophagaceae bacterium]
MNFNPLGKSGLQVSELSFGCMSLGTNDEDNARLIHYAIDNGINYFDTADLYQKGQNEITVGRALKGKRDKIILATKVGNQWRADGSGWDWNPQREYILRCVDESLKRLDVDYIDVYQLHGGTLEDPIDEVIATFEQLVQQGKIRFYGISSIRPNVIREYVAKSNIISVMMQYSLLDRRPEEACLSLLAEKNIGVLARGSLATGLLVNKTADPYLNYSEDEVHHAASAVQAISGESRKPSHTALRFVLQQRGISSAVVGIRTMEQLKDVLATLQTPELTESEIQYLRASLPVNYYEQHR